MQLNLPWRMSAFKRSGPGRAPRPAPGAHGGGESAVLIAAARGRSRRRGPRNAGRRRDGAAPPVGWPTAARAVDLLPLLQRLARRVSAAAPGYSARLGSQRLAPSSSLSPAPLTLLSFAHFQFRAPRCDRPKTRSEGTSCRSDGIEHFRNAASSAGLPD